jgi:hypothetical protein
MKVRQQFLITETIRKVRRTYGGSNYTLSIWENKGVGKLIYIGEVSACSSAHKGELSEAWGKILELKKVRRTILKEIKTFCAKPENKNYSYLSYYTWNMTELFGIELKQL